MKKFKILVLALLAVLITSQLAACDSSIGDIYIYNHAQVKNIVKAEYLEDLKIGNVYYDNDDFYDNLPPSKTVLIKDSQTYNEMFYEDAEDVNFNDYMVILHVRANIGTSGYLDIESAELDENGILNVVVKRTMNNLSEFHASGGTRMPIYFMLVVEWQDAKSACVVFEP